MLCFNAFFLLQGYQGSSRSSRSSTKAMADLVKCWCGCTYYKREEIEQALKATSYELMKTANLRRLLEKFMEAFYKNVKPPIVSDMQCHKLCEDLLDGTLDMDDDIQEQLEEYCFDEYWESLMSEAFEDQEQENINEFLNNMMREAEIRIENHPEYSIFKAKLMEKLKK